ncbi:MAG: enoyl-CoA hydratase [Sulfuricaulis sp.]|nr:enoyl-CoA hydratase [Sulfuricaulis sp.]
MTTSNNSEPALRLQKFEAGYAIVTLNRPLAMNALSARLCQELTQTFRQLAADPTVRVLILTGAGRAFCAGLDLKELGRSTNALLSNVGSGDDPIQSLAAFKGPIIGAINGTAITGGFELALACDVLIASTQARFADTHARVGVMPGWGLSQKLSRSVGLARAKEISLSGNFVSAERALAIGLVNRLVEPDELMAQATQLALDMLSAVPEMLVAYKTLMDTGFAMSLADGLELEHRQSQAWNQALNSGEIEQRRTDVRQRGRAQMGES